MCPPSVCAAPPSFSSPKTCHFMLSPRLFFNSTRYLRPRTLQLTRTFISPSRIMAQEYKLKGLSNLDLKPGEKREVEVEGVEEGKVLLCNVGGKTTAIGSKCTHYGAPLVKGVLTVSKAHPVLPHQKASEASHLQRKMRNRS